MLAHGPTKASVRLAGGVQCDLRGVAHAQFPFALHYFTGSKAHNIAMRKRAIARGLRLNEYGLEGPDGPVPCGVRGGAVPGPRPARTSRPNFARTSASSRPPRPGRSPDLVDPRRPPRDLPLPHRLERRRQHARGDGRGRPRPRPVLPRHRRPLPIGRLRRGPEHRPGPPPVGGDRRPERLARRRVPALQGDRVRHPGRRLARLPRRGPRRLRLRGRQRPLGLRACRSRR